MLAVLDGRDLGPGVTEAAELLTTVVGQDLEPGEDGRFRIARKVAKDRVISTVDPDARHGHKTQARGFDGYKGHVAADPDSEIITGTVVTPGNVADAAAADDLIEDLLTPDTNHGDPGDAEAEGVRRTPRRRCTVIPPTGRVSSRSVSGTPASTRDAGPSRPLRRPACSPRMRSPSISTATP